MAAALRQQSIGVLIVSPKRVRDFAKAAGRRAKNDPIDADTIAWFGEVFIREGGTQPDPAREQLVALVAERQDVVAMRVQCLNREEHQSPALCRKLRKDMISFLDQAIAKLDAAIADLIAQSPPLAERAALLTSVPCLGRHTVAALLAWLPELGEIPNPQVAALVGVASRALKREKVAAVAKRRWPGEGRAGEIVPGLPSPSPSLCNGSPPSPASKRGRGWIS